MNQSSKGEKGYNRTLHNNTLFSHVQKGFDESHRKLQ